MNSKSFTNRNVFPCVQPYNPDISILVGSRLHVGTCFILPDECHTFWNPRRWSTKQTSPSWKRSEDPALIIQLSATGCECLIGNAQDRRYFLRKSLQVMPKGCVLPTGRTPSGALSKSSLLLPAAQMWLIM